MDKINLTQKPEFGHTLLLVDDAQINLDLLSDIFKDSYNILTADNGRAALKIMREHDNIDVVLLDILMPEVSGYDVLREMREDEKLRFIPVIVITSYKEAEAEYKAFELGAADYITRPFNATAVIKRVDSVLHQRELEHIKDENKRLKSESDSKKHLSALMDNLPGGVAVIETDGKRAECTYFNHSVPELFGISGEKFTAQFGEKEYPEWITAFINSSRSQTKLSFDFSVTIPPYNDGENERVQWIRLISSGIGENNGKTAMYCVFLDINIEKIQEQKAKEADEKLRENEAHFENMINNSLGGVALCEQDENGDLKVVYCSKGLSYIMGCLDYDRYLEDVTSNASERVVSISDVIEFKEKFKDAAASGRSLEHNFRCLDYTDNEIWVKMRGQITENNEGRYSIYGIITDITKEKEYEQELKTGAYFDPLTGVYNRNAFFINAQRMIDSNHDVEYAVMRFNIASFKLINDMLGRDVGDRVLICVADSIRSIMPDNSIYARFHADSFGILVPCGEVDPEFLIETVKNDVKKAGIIPHDMQYYVGVCLISDNDTRIDDICDHALMACRSITGSFNRHVAYYDDRMRFEMLEEQEICDEAHKALLNGEFCIYYQSVYGITAKRFVSAEALVRWNHPKKGLISPGKFIPIFERNGFIAELDMYVLEQVCVYQHKRNQLGLPPFPISVNVSRTSLYNPNLYDIISGLTDKYGVDPRSFRIEVTETAYNDNPAQLLETIGKLRKKGYPILMDDFGSGYSSLNTLKDIPIDILKLDMKFMQGFEVNSRVGTIVTSVARMSKWLNTPMLAEGVETKEQYDFLKSIGCAYIQGYYFSKPVCEESFSELIAKTEIIPIDQGIESYGISEDVNEILGSNAMVSKLISGVFGGLGIYEINDGRLEVIRVNEGYMQIMGYTPTDYKGERYNVWESVFPGDVEKSKQACMEAWRSNKAVRAMVRRYDKNGKLLYLDGIHRRLGGSDENPIFCIAFNDITDQIESDRIIRRSKEQISDILYATGAMVIDVDYVGDNTFCSGRTDVFPFEVQELVDMIKSDEGLSVITHPDEKEKMQRFHRLRSSQRVSMDFRIKNKHGDYTWCNFTKSQTLDADGNIIRMMGIINNIDAEKRAAQDLANTQEQVDITMNNINAGVLIVELSSDNSANIIYCNQSFWHIIGISQSDSFNLVEYIENILPKKTSKDIKKKISLGETANFQFCSVGDDGGEIWVECTLTPTKSHDHGKRRYLAIWEDVTEMQRAAYRIKQLVSNFDSGLGLISRRLSGKISLPYANNKFFDILSIDKDDKEKTEKTLKEIIGYEADDTDITISDALGGEKTVKLHRSKIDDIGNVKEESFIIVAEDVTLKRSEAKNRIDERKANALRGLYDEVFKINYRARTSLMVFCRNNQQKAKNARPVSLDYVTREWTIKNIHPDDRERARAFFLAPETNPDFTDSYAQIRLAVPHSKDMYKTFGMVLVRSGTDTCMLFYRDMDRMDTSATSEEVMEVNRLYKIVAEQSNTTVIECDHLSGKVTVSPLISMYAAAALSEDEFVKKENYIKGFVVHPEDRPKFEEFAKQIGKSEELQVIVLRMEMADGSFKWCRLSISTTLSNTGEILKSLCTINLVHEEIEAQRRAETVDNLMRKTVKHIPVGVGIYKLLNGMPVPIYLSDNVYKIFGIDEHYKDIDPKIVRDFMKDNRIEPGKEGEYTQHCERSDGTHFWLNTKYIVRDEDEGTVLYAAIDDVSEQMEEQRGKVVQDQMYQMILEETGTIIFHYDIETDRLNYYEPTVLSNKKSVSIKNYSDNVQLFIAINEKDREKFAEEIKKLSVTPAASELVVNIDVDGYPRRFRAFFKSMVDREGNVFRIIGKIEDIDEEMSRLDKIKAKAMYDSLCVDIYNKATTEELIRAELDRNTSGALIMIDVDDFKKINDSLGHIFGDEFLKEFATTVKSLFRDSDIVGRYGGDEFFIYLNHAGTALAVKKGEQILEKISQIKIPEIGYVKSSIGIAVVNPDNREYRQIIKQADTALYAAKNRGKNQVVLFDPNTMSENSYRTSDSAESSDSPISAVLSSNPKNSASIIMRIFSALYSTQDLSVGINKMLALAGKTFDVSRAYIFEDTADGKYCCNTFEWCNDGVNPEMDTLQDVSYDEDLGGNYRENMNDDGIFYCHDINELNTPQREILARQNIKSVLQCAIMDKGEFKGFVGFDECRSNRFWTQGQIDALAFISKVISIFLLKDRNAQNLQRYAKSIKSILDNYPQNIFIVEKETSKLLYLNKRMQEEVGCSCIGESCSKAICKNEKNKESCPIYALRKKGSDNFVEFFSPVFKKYLRAQSIEVEWEGEKAYLVSCYLDAAENKQDKQ